jgi:uncharacterized membrane protein
VDDKDTSRLEAFSDGVFAVAITLLVLTIKVDAPPKLLDDADLTTQLRGQWPMLLAFATSFFTIGIMWLNHHRLFKHIKRTDTGLLFINLVLLFIIVFVPIPTALLAEYLIRTDLHVAAILYNGTFLAMACCMNLLWHYASYRGRLLGKEPDLQAVMTIKRQYRFGPLLYLIAFGLAWINTPASIIFNLLLALVFAAPGLPQISLPLRFIAIFRKNHVDEQKQ